MSDCRCPEVAPRVVSVIGTPAAMSASTVASLSVNSRAVKPFSRAHRRSAKAVVPL